MKVIAPVQPTTTVAVVASETVTLGRSGIPANLQVGQILRATVLDSPNRGQVLLAVDGNSNNRLLAESNLSLQPGQTLSLRLIANEPRTLFSIANSQTTPQQLLGKTITVLPTETTAVGRPGINTGASAQTSTTIALAAVETTVLGRPGTALNLETGQTLRATVLDLPARGQAMLALDGNGGQRLLVESNLPLQPGQTLSLRLVANEPRMLFSIADNVTTAPQLLGKNVAVADKALNVTTLFTQLKQTDLPLLPRLSPGSQQILLNYLHWQQAQLDGPKGGQALRQMIEHLGLNLERSLTEGSRMEAAKTSLKAALLETSQQLGQIEGAKGAAQAKSQVTSMLSAIEMFQLAQAQLATGKEQVYPLPLPFLETGYLQVDDDGGHGEDGKDEKMPAKFSLFLSLTEFGFLRIDFVTTPEGLGLRFRADSQEKADFAAGFTDDLRQAINNVSDLPVISLSFTADAQDPVKELLLKMLPDNSGLLNTTA